MAAVQHKGATPELPTTVPRHTRIHRRESGMYYLRAKVPLPLRAIVGKTEIFVSLKTKDYCEAIKRVKVESLKADKIIEAAEAQHRGRPYTEGVSDEELRWLASKAFVTLETESLTLVSNDTVELEKLSEEERAQEMRNWREGVHTDLIVLEGCDDYPKQDTDKFVESLVKKAAVKVGITPGTETYRRAFPLLRQAVIENFRRHVDRVHERSPRRIEFRDLEASTNLPPRPHTTITLGALLDQFSDHQKKTRAVNTPAAYATSIRTLREELGNDTPLGNINRHDIERVFTFLTRVPLNATQRYRGLTLAKAVEKADRENDQQRLSTRTLKNYLVHFTAIFNFAIEYDYLTKNPAKSPVIRDAIKAGEKRKRRVLFTDEQLKAMFHAPIYTGCVDDRTCWHVAGPNHPKRGRFWIPLLGLFQGFRSNEACQLHADDVSIEDGIPVIDIREDTSNGLATEKRIKTESSERRVPIHPELLRMGFLEFVETRRGDTKSPQLFPELKFDKVKQTYSHDLSKWFKKFVRQSCGPDVEATFHSFRHHFRSALMNAHIPTEFVEALGGWTSKASSEIEYRHHELPALLAALEKVSYRISFEHLHTSER